MRISQKKFIDHALDALKKNYLLVGKTHVKTWQGFLILGIVVGIAAGILFVANRDGKTNPSHAETAGQNISSPAPVKIGEIPADASIIFRASRGVSTPHTEGPAYLFAMDKTSQHVTQLTSDLAPWIQSEVSPNHKYIAAAKCAEQFTSPCRATLWTLDLEAKTEAQLVPSFESAAGGGMGWSSDQWIYFNGKRKTDRRSYNFKIRSDGTGLMQLSFENPAEVGFDSDLSVSPDGSLVAYFRMVAIDTPQGKVGKPQIWVMNADGSNQRMIDDGGPEVGNDPGSGPIGDYDPSISPDNKYVVFSRTNTQYKNFPDSLNTAHDLWIAPFDRLTPAHRITQPGPVSIAPDWSVDNKILYTEYNEKENYIGLVMINPDGTGKQRLEQHTNLWDGGMLGTWIPTNTSPQVKLGKIPDSAELVFNQDGFIYVMDHTGVNVTQITFDTPRQWDHVAVSHDRRYIAAVENSQTANGPKDLLWLFNLQQGTQTQLVPSFAGAGGGGVDWDRAGFVYFAGVPQQGLRTDLYKIRSNGTGLTQITNTPELAEADVSVSDDGTMIAYILGTPHPSAGNIDFAVYVMNSNGTNNRLVKKANHPVPFSRAGIEGIADPELSPDNTKVVFSEYNPDVPPNFPIPGLDTAHDIWSINVDGTGLTRLTKPGPISIIPDWVDNMVVYTEFNGKDSFMGASIVRADGIDQIPQRIRARAIKPKFIPAPVPPSPTGTIRVKRVGSDSTTTSIPQTSAWVDSNLSLKSDNPANFPNLAAGSHAVYATKLSGYTVTAGACSRALTDSTGCTVTNFTLAPVCRNAACRVSVAVSAGQLTKVVFKYIK